MSLIFKWVEDLTGWGEQQVLRFAKDDNDNSNGANSAGVEASASPEGRTNNNKDGELVGWKGPDSCGEARLSGSFAALRMTTQNKQQQ